jgi:LacI family transcriptional regulator
VPEDVSVTGFDDTFIARSIVPQLTSVRQPLRDMGARAVELLLQRIERGGAAAADVSGPVVFPAEVVSRASVGPRPTVERLVGADDRALQFAECSR